MVLEFGLIIANIGDNRTVTVSTRKRQAERNDSRREKDGECARESTGKGRRETNGAGKNSDDREREAPVNE